MVTPMPPSLLVRDLRAMDLVTLLSVCYVEHLYNCSCYSRLADKAFLVDCKGMLHADSEIFSFEIDQYVIEDFSKFCIDISYNNLTKLGVIPKNFGKIEVNASNNLITTLSKNMFSREVIGIDLSNNRLTTLEIGVIQMLKIIGKFQLEGNPWNCECSSSEFLKLVRSFSDSSVLCQNLNRPLLDLEPSDLCFDFIPIIAAFAGLFGLAGILTALFYKFKTDIKIFLYAHNMCIWFANEEELDKDKVYDAFFCFAGIDQNLVEEIIVDLEKEPNNFRCLVGVRDWMAGEMIPELVSLYSDRLFV